MFVSGPSRSRHGQYDETGRKITCRLSLVNRLRYGALHERFGDVKMADDLASAIMASAQRLQIDPLDLATAISYETAGTFDPWKRGPTTKYGQHRGLIQWGEPQREKYGVYEGMPNSDQLMATEKYLTDAGVKPKMDLLDIYSAINAGRVNRYDASDANNGGAWGTVRDKVESQMDGHRRKAEQLLAAAMKPDPVLGADRRLAMGDQRRLAMNPSILGADARQSAQDQQVAINPALAPSMQSETPVQQPGQSPLGSALGAMISGFQNMGAQQQPAGPRVLQDDSAQAIAAAQGLKERGMGLKSAFAPDVASLMALGKRPTVV
jgi:hypothetical protein